MGDDVGDLCFCTKFYQNLPKGLFSNDNLIVKDRTEVHKCNARMLYLHRDLQHYCFKLGLSDFLDHLIKGKGKAWILDIVLLTGG